MAFLQLQALCKRYGPVDAVVATDLSVEQGEFVSLLGPSGCGKTTTLQMIAGFVDVSAGRILLDGRDWQAWRGVSVLCAVPAHERARQRGLRPEDA
jgi:ABC-type Fe3+/spermidine/putrescine transport system ATPase subunit